MKNDTMGSGSSDLADQARFRRQKEQARSWHLLAAPRQTRPAEQDRAFAAGLGVPWDLFCKVWDYALANCADRL